MADNNKKWDCSDGYIWNFNQWRQDAYYLSTVIFNDGKREEMKIEADEKGYYLLIINVPEYDPTTNKIGKADPMYSDLRLLVPCSRRGEKNFNQAVSMMEDVARESVEMMEEDKKFLRELAEESGVEVDEMRRRLEELKNDIKNAEVGESKNQGLVCLDSKRDKKDKKKKPNKKKVMFDDIAGMEDEKELFLDVIDQLKNPERYEHFDIEPIKSLLMYGLPGVGKTYIANAFANMIDADFVKVNMGDIASKYQGQTGNNIKKIFDDARKSEQFTVIFWDECDAVANRRGADENSKEKNATLNVLLTEMSSDDNDNIFLIFATNFVELLDPAFLRSGRCDVKIEVKLPCIETRVKILELNTRKKPLNQNVDLKTIAEMMEGANCADVSLLCNQSARCALKKGKMEIDQEDFIEALEKMNMKKKEEENRKQIGFSL